VIDRGSVAASWNSRESGITEVRACGTVENRWSPACETLPALLCWRYLRRLESTSLFWLCYSLEAENPYAITRCPEANRVTFSPTCTMVPTMFWLGIACRGYVVFLCQSQYKLQGAELEMQTHCCDDLGYSWAQVSKQGTTVGQLRSY
jgi:hypothetical protein